MGMNPESNLPSNVVPLDDVMEQKVLDALQGSWSIKAISMSEAMQKLGGGNELMAPISFSETTVVGMSSTMSGAGGMPVTSQFKFSKSPETGQIYLDTWGSIVATPGWPDERPMAGEQGEIIDLISAFGAVRWTRTDAAGDAAFGEVQKQPLAGGGGGGGGGAAEVKRLMELRDLGVLSEDEFTMAKRKALGI